MKFVIVNQNEPTTELYHYGIKGQKWGIRRFQNPDGTLTAAGRKRYSRTVDSLKKIGFREREDLNSGDTAGHVYEKGMKLSNGTHLNIYTEVVNGNGINAKNTMATLNKIDGEYSNIRKQMNNIAKTKVDDYDNSPMFNNWNNRRLANPELLIDRNFPNKPSLFYTVYTGDKHDGQLLVYLNTSGKHVKVDNMQWW